jgi:hypothetical protein
MNTIKAIAKEDADLQGAIARTGRDFDYFWTLAQTEEIDGLRILTKDDLRTAAFFKKIIRAMLRAYDAGNKAKRIYDPGSDDAKRHSINIKPTGAI